VIARALLASIAAAAAAAAQPHYVASYERLGGATTVDIAGPKAFTFPAANIAPENVRPFFFGNRVFNTNWTQAPGSVQAFDGLGPLFNRVSCSGCHVRDGRGRAPATPAEGFDSMLLRLSVPGTDDMGGPRPHPVYGDQLQDKAIAGVPAEGRPRVAWKTVLGRYGDGEAYTLLQPVFSVERLGYGPLGRDTMLSPRVAPQVIGMGLLEAVPEAYLRAFADPDDSDGDGISGRFNRVWDPVAGREATGRFGWKANTATVAAQAAAAAHGDIGLTSPVHPSPPCTAAQTACAGAPGGGQPELSQAFLDRLTLYLRLLGVPAQRGAADPLVMRGEKAFADARCWVCHQPTLKTGPDAALKELAGQTFHPFTDLLLHDMGPGLADGRPDFLATGSEWRTPPLWGIGLFEAVNGHTRYLHDGRARDLAEAILWHGGEAQASRDAFAAMPKADRAALIAYLRSL
jgi:CxxC motif-containing protein (DUF1111 family)